MVVDFSTWHNLSNGDQVKSIAPELGLNDSKHYYGLYGVRSSVNILRARIQNAARQGVSLVRTQFSVDCGDTLPSADVDDIPVLGMINTRYTKKSGKDYLVNILNEKGLLTPEELGGMTNDGRSKANLDTILSINTEERIDALKEALPNLVCLVFIHVNPERGINKDAVAVIIDQTKIIEKETVVIGGNIKEPKLVV